MIFGHAVIKKLSNLLFWPSNFSGLLPMYIQGKEPGTQAGFRSGCFSVLHGSLAELMLATRKQSPTLNFC